MSLATNLVDNDTNNRGDIFLRDRQSGTTERVSVASDGQQGDLQSFSPAASADDRYVVFASLASNLVAGDTNSEPDIFVHDVQTRFTTRVSVGPGGAEADGGSYAPTVSADGRYVAFWSFATNLVAGDTNGWPDVFVHDRQTGSTTRVSVPTAGGEANRPSFDPSISGDGRYVAYVSLASNLVAGDTNGVSDIFVYDRQTGSAQRVSVGPAGEEGDRDSALCVVSADGRHVAFVSFASNLVPGDTNEMPDVFVRDLEAGATKRVSVPTGGLQADGAVDFLSDSWSFFPNGSAVTIPFFPTKPSVSADGGSVAFASHSSDLVTGDTNQVADAFVHDMTAPPPPPPPPPPPRPPPPPPGPPPPPLAPLFLPPPPPPPPPPPRPPVRCRICTQCDQGFGWERRKTGVRRAKCCGQPRPASALEALRLGRVIAQTPRSGRVLRGSSESQTS